MTAFSCQTDCTSTCVGGTCDATRSIETPASGGGSCAEADDLTRTGDPCPGVTAAGTPSSTDTCDDSAVTAAATIAAAAASMSWHMQSPCALRTPHPHPLEALSSRTRATHRPWMHLYWLQSGLGQPYRASENPTSSAPLQSGSCARPGVSVSVACRGGRW